MLAPFQLLRPRSVAEALPAINEDSVAYCGGTEILLAMKMGLYRPTQLVDLKHIDELRRIEVGDGELVIGAAASHDRLARSADVRRHAPFLAHVEQHIGNPRIRAQGTIGGNLCFAEPRSDVTVALTALGASLTLASPSASRTIGVPEFLLGPYWTAREDDELLLTISVPLPSARGVYLKFQTSERPVVGVAIVLRPGTVAGRVVVGSVSDLPVVHDFDDVRLVDPAEILDQLEPVGDSAGSALYKRQVTGVYLRRALVAILAEVAS